MDQVVVDLPFGAGTAVLARMADDTGTWIARKQTSDLFKGTAMQSLKNHMHSTGRASCLSCQH